MRLSHPGVVRRVLDVTPWSLEAFFKVMLVKIGNLMGVDLPSIIRNLRLFFRAVLVREIFFLLLKPSKTLLIIVDSIIADFHGFAFGGIVDIYCILFFDFFWFLIGKHLL